MTQAKTKVFKSNQSQAVRLSKEVALPESVKNVKILKMNNKRIILPAVESWDEWFASPGVSDDFMSERLQPEDQIRESL
jgi:antitoxin VapB